MTLKGSCSIKHWELHKLLLKSFVWYVYVCNVLFSKSAAISNFPREFRALHDIYTLFMYVCGVKGFLSKRIKHNKGFEMSLSRIMSFFVTHVSCLIYFFPFLEQCHNIFITSIHNSLKWPLWILFENWNTFINMIEFVKFDVDLKFS